MNGMYALVFGTIMLLVAFLRGIRSLLAIFAMKVAKSTKWFKPFGWIYRPITAPGYAVFFLMVVFCFHIIIASLLRAHSVSDALYTSFPFVIPAFGLYLWIGSKAS